MEKKLNNFSSVLKEVSKDTSQWINSIQNQKLTLNNSANISSQLSRQNPSNTGSNGSAASTTSSTSAYLDIGMFPEPTSPSLIPQEGENGGGGGGLTIDEIKDGLPKIFVDICVNGNPRQALVYGQLL
jgi:hypothetical protein